MGEGIIGELDHVKVLEGVELPHACGGGDGEQELAGLAVGVGRLELDSASLVEQVADVTEAEEGPDNVVPLQGGRASALEPSRCLILLQCPRVFVSDDTSYLLPDLCS